MGQEPNNYIAQGTALGFLFITHRGLFGNVNNLHYLCRHITLQIPTMPKVLLYITAKIIWNFLFFNTDFNENRAHVHVGKRGTEEMCKIWLEPNIELAKPGDLTEKQIKEVMDIASRFKEKLLKQWAIFKAGKAVKIIKIKE